MLQPRLTCPSAIIEPSLGSFAAAFNALTLCRQHAKSAQATLVRYASHAAQGRANGPKDSAGRRLGAKKTASQYVIPGNIIFRQRGTKWHPGENVGIGKDHTIYATEAGYVRYYQDPSLHKKRRYIGVALEREGKLAVLPTPRNAATRRRLGMYATPIKSHSSAAFLESHLSANSSRSSQTALTPTSNNGVPPVQVAPVMRRGTHMQREANFEIGRAAEKKGITVREYDRGDRWLAWRKRAQKIRKSALAKAAKANRKTKGKKTNKSAKVGLGPQR